MSTSASLNPAELPEPLRALFFDPATHAQALTRLTGQALRDGDVAAAFAFADRRCRIKPLPDARDYLLRAEAARRLGAAERAIADIRRALEIDPTDLLVNVQALKLLAGAEGMRAARAVIATPHARVDQRQSALTRLVESGEAIIAYVERVGSRLAGFATWPEGEDAVCRLTGSSAHDTFALRPDPRHPLAMTGRRATAIDIERPGDEAVVVTFAPAATAGTQVTFRFGAERRSGPSTLARESDQPPCDLNVIVPVYEDFERTQACLDSLAAQRLPERRWTTLVVNDASPNPRIVADLEDRARRSEIRLITHAVNQGFAAAVNAAASGTASGDILLLNADTLLPPGALQRLLAAATAEPGIGTVTPLSNNGELTSFPASNSFNDLPAEAELWAWDRAAAQVNGGVIDLTNGIGFCLLIRRACWDAVGGMSLSYGRGYYEDVDLCLRARELGFRSVCTTDLIVGHAGSRSFQESKRALVVRNLGILETRHPEFRVESAAFLRADPLRPIFGRIEREIPPPSHSLLVVTVRSTEHVTLKERLAEHEAAGRSCLVLSLVPGGDGQAAALRSATDGIPQSLRFTIDEEAERERLLSYLRRAGIARIELMEPQRCPVRLSALLERLGRPFDLYLSEPLPQMSPCGQEGLSPAVALRSPLVQRDQTQSQAFDRMVANAERVICSDAMICTVMDGLSPAATLVAPSQGFRPKPGPAAHSCRESKILAVLSPVASSEVTTLVAALARRLPCDGTQIHVVGATLNDLSAMAARRVFVSGTVPMPELANLLAHLAPDALLLPYRGGVFHVLEAAREAVSCPSVFFDMSDGRYPTPADDLALNPAICDDEAAARITAWLLP